ncbi:MAG: polymer-forming cytoskeletal protein [Spirochaetales bacterium]|nr:polymer-forming cytoskeletal protein [Spirochaetales bacterium]
MGDFKMKDIDENEIDTILADDIDFEGIISFEKDLMIKGKVNGEIKASGNLFVDRKAEVKAKIEANVVTSKGRVVGDIYANKKVALYSTAVIQGNVSTPELEIESGAKINGHCKMRHDEPDSVIQPKQDKAVLDTSEKEPSSENQEKQANQNLQSQNHHSDDSNEYQNQFKTVNQYYQEKQMQKRENQSPFWHQNSDSNNGDKNNE